MATETGHRTGGGRLDETELGAWRGFLRAHAALVRDLDAELQSAHGLSLSSYEVLLLLAGAGRAGLDAAALSRALYGHVGSLVTIRAEVSRLRKAVGGLVLTRPYRLAPEVEVVLPDLATSPFVAASTAPEVRALAGA
jgi:hypothetical protein